MWHVRRLGWLRALLLAALLGGGPGCDPGGAPGGTGKGEGEGKGKGEGEGKGEDVAGPLLPGVARVDAALVARLSRVLDARGPEYRPHTRHLRDDGTPRFVNRLIESDSPYLLQHAHNPVNWYPWGDEAFEAARRSGRPVFVSIGYSTCHWCHVMERESFEDEEIAAYLNANYIAIKVDREQRPDVDDVYMRAVQLLTGRGGWPMTVVMTPDRDPFFGGTYFPPRDGVSGRGPGLLSILEKLRTEFEADPTGVVARARQLSQRVQASMAVSDAGPIPDAAPIVRAVQQAAAAYDARWGGFGRAPKFPRPSLPSLLLRYHRRTGDARALQMVVATLEGMLHGGLYDHVGGGFHRYSTDARWLVPHFEKMLYDNAQLVELLLDAYQATGRADFRDAARRTLDYVRREMTAPGGGFYSATDADSPTPVGEEVEGYYFTWTPQELVATLGSADARVVGAYFGVTPAGNLEGRSVLSRFTPVAEVASGLGMAPAAVTATVDRALPLLRSARARRPAPHRDDKQITAWNGLMIGALSRGGIVLDDPALTASAAAAADLLLKRMRDGRGRLLRSFLDGRASHLAYLDDHAFLIAGLLDVFEASAAPRFLKAAVGLQQALDARFGADVEAGYYTASTDHEALIARQRPSYDGAEPSGNSVALENLLRLFQNTGEDRYRKRAEAVLAGFASDLTEGPGAAPYMLSALERYLDRPREVFIVRPEAAADDSDAALMEVVRGAYLPNRLLLRARDGAELSALAAVVPGLEGKAAVRGRATAFVCERGRCELPTHSPAVLRRQLARVHPLPGP